MFFMLFSNHSIAGGMALFSLPPLSSASVTLTNHGIGQQCVEPATIDPSTVIVGAVGAASLADYC